MDALFIKSSYGLQKEKTTIFLCEQDGITLFVL